MKRILLASIIALSAATASAASYKIDSAHTNARFEIDHFGTSSNVGGIYGLEGKLDFDLAKRTGSIDVKLPLANLQTGSQHFTDHLKSADLFNAEKFPEMRFQSTKFVFSGKKVKAVQGKLTLLGKTHPVTLTATKFNCYQSPMLKTQVCGGDFTTTIDRSKWGMNYLVDVGMTKKVKLNIQIEAGKE
ncbi:YceI family protein [Alysiella crassa]|uniref:Uncharacterized conserved protein n=1 Tax=Alysiella crassa TaxID=153491 RepID=A0A376BUY2_9NEIS|nr:YceI family protein [Alysiella crassa]UOP06269.1 YceI family protein [Alysiella crassa]SSY80760.1 Uncharacterized conserved protein [Alysiella crassa]